MSTTIQSNPMNISLNRTEVQTKTKSVSTFWKEAEASRFFVTPMLLLVVVCIAGFGAAYGIKDSVFQLGLITFPATTVLAMILSLVSMRAIVYASTISVIISLLVVFF